MRERFFGNRSLTNQSIKQLCNFRDISAEWANLQTNKQTNNQSMTATIIYFIDQIRLKNGQTKNIQLDFISHSPFSKEKTSIMPCFQA